MISTLLRARYVDWLYQDKLCVWDQRYLLDDLQQCVIVFIDQNGPLNALYLTNQLVNRIVFRCGLIGRRLEWR